MFVEKFVEQIFHLLLNINAIACSKAELRLCLKDKLLHCTESLKHGNNDKICM